VIHSSYKTSHNSIDNASRIRRYAVKMVSKGKSSHIGSALSSIDILAVLYSNIMHYRTNNPGWSERDRFVMSKGHAGAGLYATLAVHGFFPTKELSRHYSNGSPYSGHVSHKNIPGVEFSTGSLGHGLPVSTGMALSAKIDMRTNRSFVLMGDGELVEGSNWEAIFFAAHHKLDNLVVIIDRNNLQSMDTTENTIGLESIEDKFKAFNWTTKSVDGHNHSELSDALRENKTKKPLVIIANTTKGKGVSYMENQVVWHYKYPDFKELEIALRELEE